MPLTFPSHAAAVLPVWMRWPRLLEPVSLVIGSLVPDLAYVSMTTANVPTHRLDAALWWAVPIGLPLTVALRWAIPVAVAQLPASAPTSLRELGTLGNGGSRWATCCLCLILGAATHVFWDAFTHSDGFAVQRLPLLHGTVPLWNSPLWSFLQYASSLLGGVVAVFLKVAIGRKGLLSATLGPAPVAHQRRAAFAIGVACVLALGVVAVVIAVLQRHLVVSIERALVTAMLLPVAGAAAVHVDAGRTGMRAAHRPQTQPREVD